MQRNMLVKRKKAMVMALTVALVVVAAGAAYAFLAPTGAAGEVGGDLYELVVDKFIKGPIGSAAGVALVVTGAIGAAMGKLTGAAWPLIGGGILVAAPSMATSLGMLF